MTSLALMITAMLRYSATTVAYVTAYGTPCRVDMGNVGLYNRDARIHPSCATPIEVYGADVKPSDIPY